MEEDLGKVLGVEKATVKEGGKKEETVSSPVQSPKNITSSDALRLQTEKLNSLNKFIIGIFIFGICGAVITFIIEPRPLDKMVAFILMLVFGFNIYLSNVLISSRIAYYKLQADILETLKELKNK